MLEFINQLNSSLNNFIWGPPALVLLVLTGIFLTLRTKFIQFTAFRRMIKETVGKITEKTDHREGDISPFQAISVAMGGTVGVGNIAGVATAIALGGPGAVFWMWVSGVLGMCTKFCEVVLAVHFRKKEADGPYIGGPMMYMTEGLGKNFKILAILFSIFGAFAAFGIGNMVQANSVALGAQQFGISPWITGIVLLFAVGIVTIGGLKWIANVAVIVAPFMCILYFLGAAVVILFNITQLPAVIGLIFQSAFSSSAVAGGAVGTSVWLAMRYGLARGVFSNEAGLGSAPIAHATARTDHPVRQGMWGIFEVFVDTLVICSATAFAILMTGVWSSGKTGSELTMLAFDTFYGKTIGGPLVVLSMILTAYDTNLAWCFYGETCAAYLFTNKARIVYRIIWLPLIVVGAVGGLEMVWSYADTFNGLMMIPNIIALIALSGVVVKLVKEFFIKFPK
ncbi:MAG: sodium:alanine symporter family protein [bacterium]|nr:sodium:alanine symporter family protein [bacterium]